jgi:hypothetical protein
MRCTELMIDMTLGIKRTLESRYTQVERLRVRNNISTW